MFTIKIADQIIAIKNACEQTEAFFKSYCVEKTDSCATIDVLEEDWDKIYNTSIKNPFLNKQLLGEDVAVTYDLSGIEPLIILKKTAEYMLQKDIILIHGAAIAVNGKCFIFSAPSGTGKTTHIMNWCKKIPNVIVVNGDKPFVNVEKKFVYGTPWCGKERLHANMAVPLAGIISLERGENNSIKPISFREMLPVYFQQIYIPDKPEVAIHLYQLIGKLKDIPCYRLVCNMNEDSAVVAYRGLCGEL